MADRKGYYALLGVEPTCSTEAIKCAYRELAKKYHPDSCDGGSSSQFRAINEAYVVLTDPKRRAEYDSISQTAEPPPEEPISIDPICCSECKRATAQPRHCGIRRCTACLSPRSKCRCKESIVRNVQKMLLSKRPCFRALVGWWGFPWGPIYTIGTVISNIRGGVGSLKQSGRPCPVN
jgi:hypothetical protein